jgi:hypothetical protein
MLIAPIFRIVPPGMALTSHTSSLFIAGLSTSKLVVGNIKGLM